MNRGIDIEREKKEQDGTEFVAGVLPVCAAAVFDSLPFSEAVRYFPKGEVQMGREDMADCATRDANNLLEAKLNYLYRNDLLSPAQKKFLRQYANPAGEIELSDAFTAILSGTTRRGNSLKAPLQAIHEYGCVPKVLLPLRPDMLWADYHNPQRITEEIKVLGRQFKETIGEIFYGKTFLIGEANCCTALFAWPMPVSGQYPRTDEPINHAVFIPKSDNPEQYKWAYDNYRDIVDNDFIKRLAPDYKFYDYGYRLAIGVPAPHREPEPRRGFWGNITYCLWHK